MLGQLLKNELARSGRRQVDLAQDNRRLDTQTLTRISTGKAEVSLERLLVLEGAMGWPRRFVGAVVACDTDTIQELPGLDPGLRDYVLWLFDQSEKPGGEEASGTIGAVS